MTDVCVRMRSLMTVLGVLCVVVLAAFPAQARPQCAAAKLDATGRAIDALLECRARAVGKGLPLDADCVARANAHLTTDFAKAERGDTCGVAGDAAAILGQIEILVTQIAVDLGGPGPSHCTRDKHRAAGRKAERLHDCFARAAAMGPGQGGDHTCLERAEADFLEAFDKAEKRDDCLAPAGDAGAIEERIEAGLVQSRAALAPPLLICEPVEVTATHGPGPFFGNDSLARIEGGRVPCAHTETNDVALCVFSTTPGSESGPWVESPQGNYARSGEAISLDGAPGGDHVIGAQVSSAGTFPCIEPAGNDTVAAPPATSLAAGCAVETLRSPRNSSGFPLENHATTTVCTSSDPHPDQHGEGGAETKPLLVVRDLERTPVLTCWTHEGAALNDRRGRERDINNVYLPENRHCHMSALGTATFPVAKRPGMTFIEGGEFVVDLTTPIVWRMVVPNVDIANPAD